MPLRRDWRLAIDSVDDTRERPLADTPNLLRDNKRRAVVAREWLVGHFVDTAGEECRDTANHHCIGGRFDDGIALLATVINRVFVADHHLAQPAACRFRSTCSSPTSTLRQGAAGRLSPRASHAVMLKRLPHLSDRGIHGRPLAWHSAGGRSMQRPYSAHTVHYKWMA